MIILDTNVVSALMREDPDPIATDWLDHQPSFSIWTTSITIHEISVGLALLPVGRRQMALRKSFDAALQEDLQNRVLDFDSAAALAASAITARRQRSGSIIDIRDTQIAGIATARRATLATRNARHFADLEIPVVDPWA